MLKMLRFLLFGLLMSRVLLLVPTATLRAQAPTGSIQGTVVDESGALVEGAKVKIKRDETVVRELSTDATGKFSVEGLPPGKYTVQVRLAGFTRFKDKNAEVTAGAATNVEVTLHVGVRKEEVTVVSGQAAQVSLASSENAGAVTLRGPDLEALPDDPEDLASDLKALAGPSVGTSGSELYLDGFSGGRVPPKSSIREIRINQNPFSAEYDKVGFGRIEILTKPGADRLHGTLAYKFSDAALNSRNPYSATKPDYRSNQLVGDLNGPLGKRVSFFLNFEGRRANDNAVINATVLDPLLQITPVSGAVIVPERSLIVGGRIDYQLSERHTLTGRYNYSHARVENDGIGSFTLPSRAYASSDTIHTVQLTETAILSPSAVNETRLQFLRTETGQRAASFDSTIQVLEAFLGGGAQVGNSLNSTDRWEVQNNTTLTRGPHTLRFGGRVRPLSLYDRSPRNFGGTFVFSGGLAPELDSSNNIVLDPSGNPVLVLLSSIERYQRTLALQQGGFTPIQVRLRGAGASQFSVAGGNPVTSFPSTDVGLYVQDDWRISPSVSLNAGFRWEGQSDIHDWKDFAPRVGLAWMPGRDGKSGKTVIRLGAGIFYDRFGENQMLQALRFDGQTQLQFVLNNPLFYPQVPPLSTLESLGLPQTIRQVDPNLRSPYLIQSAVGVERQLPLGIVASFSFIDTRARHLFVSRNITAPQGGSGGVGSSSPNIYQYESAATLNQDQWVAGLSRRFRGRVGVFGRYTYNRAFGTTDGPESFPANQYNLSADYGRAATDIRHSLVVGGSLLGPLRLDLSPFLVVRSGAPFNITTGHDNNGDSLYTDRPAFASDPSQPGVVSTPYGLLNPRPVAGDTIVPRNYGQGPGFVTLNLRLSRTFGLGGGRSAATSEAKPSKKGGSSGFGALGGELHGVFHDSATEHRFNLTVSVIVRNVLNTTNPGIPVGNLSSTYFNRSNWLASSSGPEDAAYGNNRRVQFQVRLSF